MHGHITARRKTIIKRNLYATATGGHLKFSIGVRSFSSVIAFCQRQYYLRTINVSRPKRIDYILFFSAKRALSGPGRRQEEKTLAP